MSLIENIRRLVSPSAAEKGAEDDVINRAPEVVREKMKEIQRKRERDAEDRRRLSSYTGPALDREKSRQAVRSEIG